VSHTVIHQTIHQYLKDAIGNKHTNPVQYMYIYTIKLELVKALSLHHLISDFAHARMGILQPLPPPKLKSKTVNGRTINPINDRLKIGKQKAINIIGKQLT
jgi:hypothetical protein